MDLTLFDLDHTLLSADSEHMWGQFLVDEGVVDSEVYARENNYFYEQYQAGKLDVHAFQRFALQPLIDNPPQRMLALRERFIDECIRSAVARHAPALIAAHRARGNRVVIITATNRFVTAPIAELLGIEDLIATDPEVVDGRYTGNIDGIPCYQDGKIKRLEAWLGRQRETFRRIYCYSDSHNDLPLLRHVDSATAVDPDPELAAAAETAGWPIISLRGQSPPAYVAG